MKTISILLVAAAICLSGCGQPAEPEPEPKPAPAKKRSEPPPKEEIQPVADYSAVQSGGNVTVTASGENRESGWHNYLRLRPGDAQPPEFEFEQHRPDGMLPQVITPFSVSATAEAPKPIEYVYVHDANGKHRVDVSRPQG